MALSAIHFAANLLDPAFKGKNLSQAEEIQGTELIYCLGKKLDLDSDVILQELKDYKLNTGLWSAGYMQRASETMSTLEWWRGYCDKTQLSKIAGAILCLSPTTGSTERSFSTQRWTHNSKRNRLTVDRAGKLTYIAHNLRLLRNTKKPTNSRTAKKARFVAPLDDQTVNVNQKEDNCGESETDVESGDDIDDGCEDDDEDDAGSDEVEEHVNMQK